MEGDPRLAVPSEGRLSENGQIGRAADHIEPLGQGAQAGHDNQGYISYHQDGEDKYHVPRPTCGVEEQNCSCVVAVLHMYRSEGLGSSDLAVEAGNGEPGAAAYHIRQLEEAIALV